MSGSSAAGFHPALWWFMLGTALAVWAWRRFGLRRGMQVFWLNVFVVCFWLASFGGRPAWPVDFFLFSNPLIALVHTVAGRALVGILSVSLAFLLLAVLFGRVFCGHVCPLGTLFDAADRRPGRETGGAANHARLQGLRRAKFLFLLAMVVAAAAGINLLGFGDPMVLLTRFATTVAYPAVVLLEAAGLAVLRPMAEWAGWVELSYLEPVLPSFEGAVFMMLLLVLLFVPGRFITRFWCRYLCPLGALLASLGRWAPYRRRAGEACRGCDACAANCPMGAIHPGGVKTDRSECIACLECVRTCPEKAVRFGFPANDPAVDMPGATLNRRAFVGGALGGLAAAVGLRADIRHPSGAAIPLALRHGGLIRPPGALPEPQFLRRCLRCGECMRACPTNTLQPDWHRAGLEGLWAPRMHLRHGACDQECNVCGLVCPTEAIRPLPLTERRHARVGAAVLDRDRCLPWARDERCLVCQEQCPYGAIAFERDERHQFDLPVVDAAKCNGCGICEDKCPITGDSAIVVVPHGELRLATGSYVDACRSRGLTFEKKDAGRDTFELF